MTQESNYFKKFLLAISLLMLGQLTCTILQASDRTNDTKPQVIGLFFHASWCSASKMIEAKLDEEPLSSNHPSFKLVTLNLDNQSTRSHSETVAESLGLLNIYNRIGVRTGFILLVHPETQEILDKIKRTDTITEIAAKIDNAIERTKS